jgi:hypothetical protein
MNVPLVEECLDLMGCEPNCSTRLSEAVLMEDVINHILAKAAEAVEDLGTAAWPRPLKTVTATIKGVNHV